MKLWYNKLGFHKNPFSIKPGMFSHDIFGNDKIIKDISKKLKESKVVFISGEFGTGKTSILKGIVANFKGKKGKKKIIYYNCNRSEKPIGYERLLIKPQGFIKRFFNIKKKNMLILLDEVQDIKKEDIEELKEYYKKGYFSAIVLVSKFEDFELLEELEDLIDGNKLKMESLTLKSAIKLVRSRIGELEMFSDKMIKKVFENNKNPRAFLKNCEDVCRYAFDSNALEVEEAHIKKVLK